jgi:hypothetical protein
MTDPDWRERAARWMTLVLLALILALAVWVYLK